MLLSEPPPTQFDLHFSFFRVPVRVSPWFWGVTVLMASRDREPKAIALWVVAVFVSILWHEFGHAAAAIFYGWPPRITLYGMGGLASFQPTGRHNPVKHIIVSLAGPGAGFLLAAVIALGINASGHSFLLSWEGPWGVATDYVPYENRSLNMFLDFLLFVNIFWGLVNLLPVWPLDGGQISRELFNMFQPGNALRYSLMLSIAVGVGIAAYALKQKDWYITLMFGVLAYSSYEVYTATFGRGGYGGQW